MYYSNVGGSSMQCVDHINVTATLNPRSLHYCGGGNGGSIEKSSRCGSRPGSLCGSPIPAARVNFEGAGPQHEEEDDGSINEHGASLVDPALTGVGDSVFQFEGITAICWTRNTTSSCACSQIASSILFRTEAFRNATPAVQRLRGPSLGLDSC